MAPPRSPHPAPAQRATATGSAESLAGVALLAARWVERSLNAHDPPLTVAQYLALRAIAREPVSGSDIARRAAVSPAAVSQLVGVLEQAGYISREPEPGNRRRHTLELTARGERVLTSAAALVRDQLGTLLAPLPQPDLDALERLLPLVDAALSGTAPPRRPPPPPPPPPPSSSRRGRG